MLIFTPRPQPLYYHLSSPRDQYLQSLAEDAARERYLNRFPGDNYSYGHPTVQDALAREYHRQQEAARAEELNRRIALERRRQQHLERQRQQQRYLAELERRRYLDQVRRAQRECVWPLDSYVSDDEPEEFEFYPKEQPIAPPSVPESSKSSKPEATLEQKHNAAAIIQSAYRSHLFRRQALNSLSTIRTSLDSLTSSFIFPAKPSFDFNPNSTSYKLSYNSVNAPIHAHEDALMKLLSKVDSVESNGDVFVRKERKQLARDIEAELGRLDQRKEEAWEVQRVEMALSTRPISSEAEADQAQVSPDIDMLSDKAPVTPMDGSSTTEVATTPIPAEGPQIDYQETASQATMDQQLAQSDSHLPTEAASPLHSADSLSDDDQDMDEPSLASLFQVSGESEEPEPTLEALPKEDFILVEQDTPHSTGHSTRDAEEDKFVMVA